MRPTGPLLPGAVIGSAACTATPDWPIPVNKWLQLLSGHKYRKRAAGANNGRVCAPWGALLMGAAGRHAEIETGLIPALAEFGAIVEIEMPAMALALVLIEIRQVLAVVQHLEIAVGLNHPNALPAQERLQDRGGVFVMVKGRVNVADVMQQRRHHPIGIAAIPPRPRRRLQRMAEPGDLIARKALVQIDQRAEQPHAVLRV